ncbi:MAG TPA: SurA N-terminal domain-containing protein [Candidatus Acidoferrum sp.]|nr:SurA N-terminal domain-containing protein [Candidatus Acidoferrum sp.]
MREGSAYFIKGVMLTVVAAFIGTIFVVWGVKSAPGDLARRGIVATVADTAISTEDYQQALRRQMDMYKQIFGDKVDEKLLESLNIKQQVLNGLIRRILILQYAERTGIGVGAEELREEIERIPAFGGKDGFSKQRYLDVLRANRLPPDRFEADMREDLLVRKAESLIRDAVKVSDTEVRDTFRRGHRQITVELVQLPVGDEGKKLADAITLAIGKGKPLAAASQESGVTAKQLGPFPISEPDKTIPDPDAFRQAVGLLKPGETSPLVTGQKASYLIRLVSQQDPAEADFEKDKASFRTQVLASKREAVLTDWLQQLRRTAKITIEQESL